MKVILVTIMTLHGLIHLMGFAKAFHPAQVSQLAQPITRFVGGIWLMTSALFLVAMGFYLSGKNSWWAIAAVAIVLSQVLIARQWKDARFGTMANVLILFPVIIGYLNSRPDSYFNVYQSEVNSRLVPALEEPILTDSALVNLPWPVIRYVRYSGAVGKPMVRNFRASFAGKMKTSLESNWVDIESQQYNFFDEPARLFYIKSSLYGLPFEGFHRYAGKEATMKIKLAGAVKVVDARGEKMDQGETVTMLNDMCLLAPATLINDHIKWETIDSLTVKATFNNGGHTISAVLHFNRKGELVNFVSGDRFLSADGETYLRYPWSTPVSNYKNKDGRMVPTYGEAIWFTPNGPFVYAHFDIKEIDYNILLFR